MVDARGQSLARKLALTVLVILSIFVDHYSELAISRYILPARAILENRSFEITSLLSDSAQTGDIAVVDGRYYSGVYPGVSVALVPVVSVGEMLLSSLPPVAGEWWQHDFSHFLVLFSIFLFSLPLTAVAAYFFSLALNAQGVIGRKNVAWTLGLIFGTPLAFYGARLHESAPVFAVMALVLYLASTREEVTWAKFALLGLCLGLLDSVNPLAMIVCAAGIAVTVGGRRIMAGALPLALGMFGPEFLLRGYLWSVFDSPFATPYQFLVHSAVGNVWSTRGWAGSLRWLMHEGPQIAWGMTFGIRGLFVFAPITAAALVLSVRNRNRWALAGLCAYLVNQALLFSFLHGTWAGGTSWGPRYLNPCLPWMIFGAAIAAREITSAWPQRMVFLSCFVTWLGLQYGTGQSPIPHLYYFFLGGPTTPLVRFAEYSAAHDWIPRRVAEGMAPSWSGQYYALTHISALGPYIAVGFVLWLIWRKDFHSGTPE